MAIIIKHQPPQCLQEVFLKELVPCSLVKLQKGEFLWHPNEMHARLYLIKSGLMKISVWADDCQERTLLFYTSGSFFGLHNFTESKTTYSAAAAMLPTTLYSADSSRVHELILRTPRMTRALTDYLVHHIYAEAQEIIDFSSANTDEKLASLLVVLADKYMAGGKMLVPLKNDELAMMVGACRNSVYNALSIFEKRKLVKKSRGRIEIVDLDRLRNFRSSKLVKAHPIYE